MMSVLLLGTTTSLLEPVAEPPSGVPARLAAFRFGGGFIVMLLLPVGEGPLLMLEFMLLGRKPPLVACEIEPLRPVRGSGA